MRHYVTTIGLAAALLVGAAGRSEAKDEGQAGRGLALEIHIGTQFIGTGNAQGLNALEPGIFFGGKIGRLIVGLGFDITRTEINSGAMGAVDVGRTTITFLPGMRLALLRSRDERFELFGQLDFGF